MLNNKMVVINIILDRFSLIGLQWSLSHFRAKIVFLTPPPGYSYHVGAREGPEGGDKEDEGLLPGLPRYRA